MVLDDDDAVATLDKTVEGRQQLAYVVEMQTCGGFVEHKQFGLPALAAYQERCQFYTLCLATAQGTGRLTQFEVSQPHVL